MAQKKPSRSRREKQLYQRYLRRIHRVFRAHTEHKNAARGDGYGADLGEGWIVRLDRLQGNRRLCRRLEVHHQIVGMIEHRTETIWIDFTADLLSTFVHECLHVVLEHKYADHNSRVETGVERVEEEAEVRRLERIIMRHLTPRQAKNLLILLLRNLAPRKK